MTVTGEEVAEEEKTDEEQDATDDVVEALGNAGDAHLGLVTLKTVLMICNAKFHYIFIMVLP